MNRAADLGPSVVAVIESLFEVNAAHRLRSAQGVVRLADRHDAKRLDAACARALAVGDPSYRTVKGILAAGSESDSTEQADVVDAPAHLHGPERLFNDGQAS